MREEGKRKEEFISQHASEIGKPRTDGQPLWDINIGLHAWPVVLVAHELKLFPLLAERPRTLTEVCQALQIPRRSAEALLILIASLGLVRAKEGYYLLTTVAEDYLLETSPTYYGWYLDLLIVNSCVFSYENAKKAVLTGKPQIYGGGDLFKTHEEQPELARAFTRGMHSLGMASALAWPEVIDLSGYSVMLDIGGSSGAHCIGATLRWPNLQAVVFDLPPVCEVAEEFITRHGLQGRIKTHVGDMWKDTFPRAGLHFYSNVYHDWPPEKCRFLTQKSFESLESGGRIIIHEMLYNDEKTGPFLVAGMAAIVLLWAEGEQYSGLELRMMLAEVGFTDIEVQTTFGYWSIVTGRKP